MSLLSPLPPRFGAPGNPQPQGPIDWNNISNFFFFLCQYLFTISNAAQTSANGGTSGTALFSQPFQGTSFSLVLIYCQNLVGAASYTFPSAFKNVPGAISTNQVSNAIVTTLTTTGVTISGTNSTGFLVIVGC
jgi:hypothetical protein